MMGRVALGMTVRLKLRRQFNVPSSMSMGEAVERIVAESARRNAMYQRNVRALHRVVEQIESRARDFLTIRERMREAQLAFLQRSCNLPVVAMFSSASVAASSVRDIVCGLDWERIRVHYDVIVRAQAVGILGTSRRAVLDSHFYSSSPPNLDVPIDFGVFAFLSFSLGPAGDCPCRHYVRGESWLP